MLPQRPACIVLTETFLKSTIISNLYDIYGYIAFHAFRESTSGGGISVYVRNSYSCDGAISMRIINKSWEQLIINISLDNKKYTIFAVYKIPGIGFPSYLDHINRSLSDLRTRVNNLYLCGDLNINLIKSSGLNVASQFTNIMVSHGFSLCVSKPTRLNFANPDNSSLIDHK